MTIVTVPCASLIIADSSFLALTSGEVAQKLRARGSRSPIYALPKALAARSCFCLPILLNSTLSKNSGPG